MTEIRLKELVKYHKQLEELSTPEMYYLALSDTAYASLVLSSVSLRQLVLPDGITVTKIKAISS